MREVFKADLGEIDRMSLWLERACAAFGADKDSVYALTLSLDELFTNTVLYGYKSDASKTVKITLRRKGDAVIAVMADSAGAFNPFENAPAPNLDADIDSREIGGLGVFFVKKHLHDVCYVRKNGRNVITLVRRLRGRGRRTVFLKGRKGR